MYSQYDFERLNSDISRLKRDIDDFLRQLERELKTFNDLKFDSSKYNSFTIKKQIERKINDAKKNLDNCYSEYLNKIRRLKVESINNINREALSLSLHIKKINEKLK